MNAIRISVIIPIYNADRYLSACLESVRGQTVKDIEIILVDDGSTDRSPEIEKAAMAEDNRVRVLRQANAGSGKARNRGLEAARGEYIAFMDADDYYPSLGVLELLLRTATEKGALICGGGMAGDSGRDVRTGRERGGFNCHPKEGFVEYLDSQIDYGYYRYLFKADLLKDNGIDFPDYLRFQDPPFFVRAMIAAGRYYALTEDTYCYRIGHQKIAWTFRQTSDLVRGILDNLVLAKDNGLWILRDRCLDRLNGEYFPIIYRSLLDGNAELLRLLARFQQNVDWTRANGAVAVRPLEELLRDAINARAEKEALERKIEALRSSATFRAGRVVTWPLRKIRSAVRCLKERGPIYTLRYAAKKAVPRKKPQ